MDRKFIGSNWTSRFREWIMLALVGRSEGILMVWDVRRVKVAEEIFRSQFIFDGIGGFQRSTGLIIGKQKICFGMRKMVYRGYVVINGVWGGLNVMQSINEKLTFYFLLSLFC